MNKKSEYIKPSYTDIDILQEVQTLEEELMTWDVGDLPLGDITGLTNASPISSDPPESVVMTSTMSAC